MLSTSFFLFFCVDRIAFVLYYSLIQNKGGVLLQNKVKAIRESLKMSQREFGEKLGVSRDVISNIEYGRVPPKELLIQHMCKLYNVNINWLETGKGEMFNVNPCETNKFDEALETFKSLRPDFQDYALEQMKKLIELQNKSQ